MSQFGKGRKQSLVVISVALFLVVASIVTTLGINLGSEFFGETEGQAYRNVTFTDASIRCKSAMKREFGEQLEQMYIDDHSSRMESDLGLYKIFIRASVRMENSVAAAYLARCYVRSRSGDIAKFEAFEHKDNVHTEVIKKGGDKFIEWPQ